MSRLLGYTLEPRIREGAQLGAVAVQLWAGTIPALGNWRLWGELWGLAGQIVKSSLLVKFQVCQRLS